MEKNSCRYFQNRECEYFPCHKNADPEFFNCLFCYCPLYALGENCGGNFRYLESGIKDCSNCLVPHGKGGYDYIIKNFSRISELAKKKD
ncbi:MAG: cysteine-rich small domain-containing protein [Clostridiales bacterium]|nr:cysteine-rich small domain-containing protein [Clostridiales bacterium]